MDAREKCSIQQCHSDLLKDLDVTKTFNTKLFCEGVISEEQKEQIEEAEARQDKVALLLEILPRRGPEAYDKFLAILQNDYPWISTKLQNERQAENPKPQILPEEKTIADTRRQQNGLQKLSIKPTVAAMMDTEIKKQVSSHINKQFVHPRKITDRDKRTMQKWICELIHQDRTKIQQHFQENMSSPSTPTNVPSGSEKNANQMDDIRYELHSIQNMLLEHLPDDFTKKLTSEKIRSQNPVKLLISQIHEEVCALIQHKLKMEKVIQNCFEILEVQEDSLEYAVQKIVKKLHEREIALNNEKYNYEILSEKIERMKHLDQMYNVQNVKLSTVRHEKYQLEEKCRTLELKIQQLKDMPKNRLINSYNCEENRSQHVHGCVNNFAGHRRQFMAHRESRNPINMMNNILVGRQVRPKINNSSM